MRRLALVALAATLGACSGSSTGPASGISVRLRDDAGRPVDRTRVVITPSSGAPVDATTRSDGTIDVAVARPGVYTVVVLPRTPFTFTDDLRRNVTLSADAHVVLDFVVYRVGVPSDNPPEYSGQ